MAEEFDAPQSRNEAILQNMLGAENELPAPQSRIEELLQEILEQGGGKFYEHNIGIYNKSNITDRKIAVTTIITNRSSTKIDFDKLIEYLNADTSTKPFGNGRKKCASGCKIDLTNSARYEVYGIYKNSNSIGFEYLKDDGSGYHFYESKSSLTIEDAVVEI